MKVCIPAEVNADELRVGATPKTVTRLIKQGFEVHLQSGAGLKSNYSDKSYEEAGAGILASSDEVYATADIILKVQAPTPEEIESMQKDQVLLCYLWPAQHPELLDLLSKKGVNAIAMDAIPRISRAQKWMYCLPWLTLLVIVQ